MVPNRALFVRVTAVVLATTLSGATWGVKAADPPNNISPDSEIGRAHV